MDKLISAEIPPKSDPVLLSVVKKQMVHSHTEACKEGSKCKKKFPKAFTPFTIMNSDGYPSYKRRSPEEGGNTFEVQRGGEIIQIDNSWIVPYCPFLSRAFQCHINVEYCSSIKSIKYVCKYVLKVRSFELTYAIFLCDLEFLQNVSQTSGSVISTTFSPPDATVNLLLLISFTLLEVNASATSFCRLYCWEPFGVQKAY